MLIKNKFSKGEIIKLVLAFVIAFASIGAQAVEHLAHCYGTEHHPTYVDVVSNVRFKSRNCSYKQASGQWLRRREFAQYLF